MKDNVKCWEVFKCDETECPVYQKKELRCWLIPGTHCRNEIQGKFLEKMEMCLQCEPFRANMDVDSMEETLTLVNGQFTSFRQMVEERDRELEDVSMELALGLSEVFGALKEISSGDPEVRIPETSRLELITKLKHMVNLTARSLAEVVDLSHEFAMGLAEHFGVLDSVSKGNLAARVSGTSQVELLEALKEVTNHMIESVSREIAERKQAGEALQKARDELERRVEERTAELLKANEQLEIEIEERKRIEEKYKTLVESSLTGIFIHQDGKYVFMNHKFEDIHGYQPDELLGRDPLILIHPDERETLRQVLSKRLKGEDAPNRYEVRRLRKDGKTIRCEMMAARIEYEGRPAIMGNIIDITERKQVEEALLESTRRLQVAYEQAIAYAEALNKEIDERKQAEEALQRKKEQLQAKAQSLEEVNTALKVLLKQREEDKAELEEKVLSNVKQLVLPYIETLRKSRLGNEQMAYVSIIESNLTDIVSPFLRRLSAKYVSLTPKEIQIADLVRLGRTTKEISDLLNVSTNAIEFHRENIRAKLGLKNKKVNLRSFLFSLE